MVKLLLLSQVFVLGRLKTHGDHLRTGQHLAAFDAIWCPFIVELKNIIYVFIYQNCLPRPLACVWRRRPRPCPGRMLDGDAADPVRMR